MQKDNTQRENCMFVKRAQKERKRVDYKRSWLIKKGLKFDGRYSFFQQDKTGQGHGHKHTTLRYH